MSGTDEQDRGDAMTAQQTREIVEQAAERRASITRIIEGLQARAPGGWRCADEYELRLIVADLLYEIGRHRQHTRAIEEALGRPIRTERDVVLWCALIEHGWPYDGETL